MGEKGLTQSREAAKVRSNQINGPTILTADGHYFDYTAPNPEMFTLHAIATGLANTCRFAGQCHRFYSVAEHSVIVSRLVPPHLAVQGLLHDAAEAFIGDMPKPLKEILPDYKRIESVVEAALAEAYGLPAKLDAKVKHVDCVMLATEQQQLMNNHDEWKWTADTQPADIRLRMLQPPAAYDLFMTRADELGLSGPLAHRNLSPLRGFAASREKNSPLRQSSGQASTGSGRTGEDKPGAGEPA